MLFSNYILYTIYYIHYINDMDYNNKKCLHDVTINSLNILLRQGKTIKERRP